MRRALGGKMKFEFVDGTIPSLNDNFDLTFSCLESLQHVDSFMDLKLCFSFDFSVHRFHGKCYGC